MKQKQYSPMSVGEMACVAVCRQRRLSRRCARSTRVVALRVRVCWRTSRAPTTRIALDSRSTSPVTGTTTSTAAFRKGIEAFKANGYAGKRRLLDHGQREKEIRTKIAGVSRILQKITKRHGDGGRQRKCARRRSRMAASRVPMRGAHACASSVTWRIGESSSTTIPYLMDRPDVKRVGLHRDLHRPGPCAAA